MFFKNLFLVYFAVHTSDTAHVAINILHIPIPYSSLTSFALWAAFSSASPSLLKHLLLLAFMTSPPSPLPPFQFRLSSSLIAPL